jgi:glycosyltransferase involved in cell wall biosynthesis
MKVLGNYGKGSSAVTVLVLTYNHSQFIEEAINSILVQKTTFEFSVLVHDDASSDGTATILIDLQKRFPDRIVLLLQSENQLSQGRRPSMIGIRNVKSKYLAFCEGDDYWTDETKLQRQYEFMEKNTWASLTHHGIKVLNQDGSQDYQRVIQNILNDNSVKSIRTSGSRLGHGNFIMTCSVMLRVDKLDLELLEFGSKYSPFDYIMFAISTHNSEIGFIDRDMAVYRLHKNNMWGLMDPVERNRKGARAMWFLAGTLDGETGEILRHSLSQTSHLEQSRGELEQSRGELEQTRGELEQTRGELEQTRGELEQTRHKANEISNQFLAIQKSQVWRMTRPLRSLLGFIRIITKG